MSRQCEGLNTPDTAFPVRMSRHVLQVEGGYYLDGTILEHDNHEKWTNNAFLGPAWCLLKV